MAKTWKARRHSANRSGTAQTDTVRLEVLRGGQTITVDAQAEPDPSDGRRKLGVWVRDSTAGVGTLTYIDPANQAYGALGLRSSMRTRAGCWPRAKARFCTQASSA